MEDQDILKLLAAGQYEAAFAPLLERYQDKVFRLAFSFMRNETQAADIAQDAFVRIWKGLPGYHGGASFSTWIYTITRNTCLTELTRRKRQPTVSLQEPALEDTVDQIASLQFHAPAPGAGMDVASLLVQLPESYRRVVTLFYLEDRAYEEVAVMLGIPLGTVKTLLFRARRELLRIHERQSRQEPGSPVALPSSGSVAAGAALAAERLKPVRKPIKNPATIPSPDDLRQKRLRRERGEGPVFSTDFTDGRRLIALDFRYKKICVNLRHLRVIKFGFL